MRDIILGSKQFLKIKQKYRGNLQKLEHQSQYTKTQPELMKKSAYGYFRDQTKKIRSLKVIITLPFIEQKMGSYKVLRLHLICKSKTKLNQCYNKHIKFDKAKAFSQPCLSTGELTITNIANQRNCMTQSHVINLQIGQIGNSCCADFNCQNLLS